jgi:hypothetical protein
MWSVKMLRVVECGYPVGRTFPGVPAWFARVRARPAFRQGVWRDVWLSARVFRARAALLNALGAGITRIAAAPQGI